MNLGKKGIIPVHFGTSYEEARIRAIDALERDVRCAYPGALVQTAFTSERIRALLQKRNTTIPGLSETLDHFLQKGVQEVILLVSFLLDGEEYQNVRTLAADYAKYFQKMTVTKPLLRKDSIEKVADTLMKIYPPVPNGTLLFMGHGSRTDSNALYRKLDDCFAERGYEAIVVPLEEKDNPDAILSRLPKKNQKIFLAPLLFTGGYHAARDMIGADNSWKAVLENNGYSVESYTAGLGEYRAIRDLYLLYM